MARSVVIVRYSEVAVKGPSTRSKMEGLLAFNLREALNHFGVKGVVDVEEGRIFIRDPSGPVEAAKVAAKVFGVKSSSPAVEVEFHELGELAEKAKSHFCEKVRGRVFRVRARRAGKHDFTRQDVEREVGRVLLEECSARGVNLTNPEYTVYIEVRGSQAFFYDTVVEGPGGLPLGSEEPVGVLFSGGFDSTVAAWLVMKRGSPTTLIFYDYGDEHFRRTAIDVAHILRQEWGHGFPPRLMVVDFRPALALLRRVRGDYRVLVARRLMLENAFKLMDEVGYMALVTGESIGQVASQTIANMRLIGWGLGPVIRPVAGFDKDEVTKLAARIGTYEANARQIEVCGRDVQPTPRANPSIFWGEYSKVSSLAGSLPYRVFGLDEDPEELFRRVSDWLARGPGMSGKRA